MVAGQAGLQYVYSSPPSVLFPSLERFSVENLESSQVKPSRWWVFLCVLLLLLLNGISRILGFPESQNCCSMKSLKASTLILSVACLLESISFLCWISWFYQHRTRDQVLHLGRGSANYSSEAKTASPGFIKNLIGIQPHHSVSSLWLYPHYDRGLESAVVVAGTMWPAMPGVFPVWLFVKKFADPCFRCKTIAWLVIVVFMKNSFLCTSRQSLKIKQNVKCKL